MSEQKLPVRPLDAPEKFGQLRRLMRFRKDMFTALPPRLYRAWMAETKTPFYKSFMINDTAISQKVLKAPNRDFPKSDTIYNSIKPLLGQSSVFVTNGDQWEMQRRIINPSFEGGRLKHIFPAMKAAAEAAVPRFAALVDGSPHDVEFECSHFAADVIFRTLFSVPIEHTLAKEIFYTFQSYQRAQPVLNFANLLRLPRWVPSLSKIRSAKDAKKIRKAIGTLVDERLDEIKKGTAPDDLATKIMTTKDPLTGHQFDREEMVDQVAIFFLAGHETSAASLGWALYLLAFDQAVQEQVYQESKDAIDMASIMKLKLTRNVFSETLRLYSPVPMLAREATKHENFRDREVNPGDLCILSVWHSARHERIWDDPHAFKPERWDDLPPHCRDAYFPFSAGERICIGAGFALVEGPLGISTLLRNFRFRLGAEDPRPVAYLTTRAHDGIKLYVEQRNTKSEG